MAEERTIPKHQIGEPGVGMSRDDMRALRYVLMNVKGVSPSSFSPLMVEDNET